MHLMPLCPTLQHFYDTRKHPLNWKENGCSMVFEDVEEAGHKMLWAYLLKARNAQNMEISMDSLHERSVARVFRPIRNKPEDAIRSAGLQTCLMHCLGCCRQL